MHHSERYVDSSDSIIRRCVGDYKAVSHEDFHGYRWLEGMNVSTYIAGLTEVEQRLKSLGETVSKETMIAKIVRGLPEQFNSFREVWRIAPNPNLTIAELQGKLMDIENESGKEQIVKSNLGDALMSKEKQWRIKSKSKQQGKQQGQSKSEKVLRCTTVMV